MTELDEIDHLLIHALQVDARAPFTRIAAVPNPYRAGRQQWIVRFTAAARAAQDIAAALARRADTSWVRLTSGGTEIVAIVQTTPGTAGSSHALLLRDVPRTASITSVSAHLLLHLYLGGPTAWRGRLTALSSSQQAKLRPGFVAADDPVTLTGTDNRLLAALARDGRTSYTDLAAATGWSATTVTRRIEELRARGALFFDVEIDVTLLGITVSAMLWMSVRPAHLAEVAATLAGHPELAVVAATTGPTNLIATALCRDTEALHHYLTHRLALDSITTLETAPVLRTLKAVAPIA